MITTGRQAFRYAVNKILNGGDGGFTPARRLDEAALARRCRNIFWNAIAPIVANTGGPSPQTDIKAQHGPFGMPIIITDIQHYLGSLLNLTYWQDPNYLVRLFTTEDAGGVDFFGSGNFTDVVQTLTHYRNRFSPTVLDGPSNKIHFNPYLLKPGQIIQAVWRVPAGFVLVEPFELTHEADFRGVTVLPEQDVYGQLCGRLKQQVCEQIAAHDPETVILDITIPSGTIPSQNAPGNLLYLDFATEPQQRPLLVYGIGTNLNGVQCTLRDPATQWQFCVSGEQPITQVDTGVPVVAQPPKLNGIPLYIVANNSEITNRDAYHMLPIPHLLEPNNSLVFRLASGLRPNFITGAFQQLATTGGLFGQSDTEVGRISLLCRTV